MFIKKQFNHCDSFIDYLIKKTLKTRKQVKYSSEFTKNIIKDLKMPKEVYENDQFTKLVCKVIADNSFNYSTEFRCLILKKLILPREVFLYQKFTKLICKVAVRRMSRSFIKMKCKRAAIKKKITTKNEIGTNKIKKVIMPKRKRGRPSKLKKETHIFSKDKKISNKAVLQKNVTIKKEIKTNMIKKVSPKLKKETQIFSKDKKIAYNLRILTASEIKKSFVKPKIDPNFYNCKVRLNCILRNSIKNELMTDSSSSIYANASTVSKDSRTTIFSGDNKFFIKMEDMS